MDRFNLGAYRRPISTSSPEAQRWFNIGLNWCYGFNHDEGAKCFEKALEHDNLCAMAHWGLAYASAPYYNLTWKECGPEEAANATRTCFVHIRRAAELADGATEIERGLIAAALQRVQEPHIVPQSEFDRWDDAYAAEMRRVYYEYPHDHDVMALFAEALMMRTVRRLWNLKTGAPATNSDALEALQICERSISLSDQVGAPPHPAVLHLHIHLLEMSRMPERAMRSAELLGEMCPDAGHMNHMPAHIYVLCGDYEKAKWASEKAVRANNLYLAYADNPTSYILSCCHDLHLMMFTCMFLGQFEPAAWAAEQVRLLTPRRMVTLPERPKLTQTLEGYHAMKSHVLVRFGRWRDIVAEPPVAEPDVYLLTSAMQHYAKAVAHAALRNFPQAEAERAAFQAQLETIPADRRFLSNPTRDSLAVGAAMLDGELAYHQGRHDEAFDHLRLAVHWDDNLSYTEPWAWMHPPRHALAALLLDQGHVGEAEQVYRDDLGLSDNIQRCSQHPNNVWALHGLAECLNRRGDKEELTQIQRQLAVAMAKTDTLVSSSCLCRTGAIADANGLGDSLERLCHCTTSDSGVSQAIPRG
jgi:tetratricopeptide (TPR) repeat protein